MQTPDGTVSRNRRHMVRTDPTERDNESQCNLRIRPLTQETYRLTGFSQAKQLFQKCILLTPEVAEPPNLLNGSTAVGPWSHLHPEKGGYSVGHIACMLVYHALALSVTLGYVIICDLYCACSNNNYMQ